jgi:hypothetical protein
MGNALNVQAWSTTAATNDGADSTIGTVANTSSPTSVDDWVRGIMAAIAKYADDTGGALVAGGSATALTVTTGQALSSGHIANGLRLCVRTGSAATGAATIAVDGLTAVDIKKNNGASAIVAGDWASGDILDLVYSSTASAFIAANLRPRTGLVLLTSGTVSSAAALDIVLTSYTGYRGLKFALSGFRPATDGTNLWVRFSSNGGSGYDTSGYNYAMFAQGDAGAGAAVQSGSAGQIIIAVDVGSAATEGYNGEITLLNQTSTAFWSRITHAGYWMDSVATPGGAFGSGGGARETNQDTDAIRFMFSSGDITAGNYAVYGLA